MPDGGIKELEELLHGFDIGLLTTRGGDGHFHTRPMALRAGGLGDGLWFATAEGAGKVADLEHDRRCGVAFYKGGLEASYVSISGMAELVRDRELIRRMWSPAWKPWFPEGPDQRDLVLIRVVPEHAEYVHPHTGRLQVLFTMARRLVGERHAEAAQKIEVDLAPPPSQG